MEILYPSVYSDEPDEPMEECLVMELDSRLGDHMMWFIKNNPKVLSVSV